MVKEDNLRQILDRVSERVSEPEFLSLWEKLREEMQFKGTDSAIQYLNDELRQCKIEFDKELVKLKDLYARKRYHG